VLCLFSIAFSKEFHSSSFLQTRLGKTRMRSTLGSSARTNLTLNTQTKVHTSTSTTYVGSRTGTGFACFLLGLILFPLSICWIFYNERSAVKDTYFTDILDKSNVKEYNPNTIGSEFIDNQLHIYRGTINIFDTAKIGNIDFEDHIKRIANLNDNTLNHNVNAKTPGHQDKTSDQTFDQLPTHNGGLDNDKSLLVPNNNLQETSAIISPVITEEKKVLAYKIVMENYYQKEEKVNDDGRVEIINHWLTSDSNLFNNQKGIFTAGFNFDGKIIISDPSLFNPLFITHGKILPMNDEVVGQIIQYFQENENFKGFNI